MNYLLIICILITIACMIMGSRRGILRIAYGLLSWIFVFWFVNYSSPFISDYLHNSTHLEQTINEKVTERLQEKYEESEAEEVGSGKLAVYYLIPMNIRESFDDVLKESVDRFIEAVSDTFTEFAMGGITSIIAIALSYFVAWLVGRLVLTINYIPGLGGVNRLLGTFAGVGEALLIIWIIMFVAESFPASAIGNAVTANVETDEFLQFLYQNNLIKMFI